MSKTPAQLIGDLDTAFPDNSVGGITPAIHRAQQVDVIDAIADRQTIEIPSMFITYAENTTLDLAALTSTTRGIILGGPLNLSVSNVSMGRFITLGLIAGAANRNLTFNSSWVFVGAPRPATLASGKIGILTLQCFGSNQSDVVAAWAAQP